MQAPESIQGSAGCRRLPKTGQYEGIAKDRRFRLPRHHLDGIPADSARLRQKSTTHITHTAHSSSKRGSQMVQFSGERCGVSPLVHCASATLIGYFHRCDSSGPPGLICCTYPVPVAHQVVDLIARGLAGCRFSRPRACPVGTLRLCATKTRRFSSAEALRAPEVNSRGA